MLFINLVEKNDIRGVNFYTKIHNMHPNDTNTLLDSCNLTKWRISDTEDVIEARWSVSCPLTTISMEEYTMCVQEVRIQCPQCGATC